MSLSDWSIEGLENGTAIVNNTIQQRHEYTHCSSLVRGVPHPGFIDAKVWELQKANLKFREGDIFVCTMSKCGTTLMEQILLLLLNGGKAGELDPLSNNTLDRSRPGSFGKIWTDMAVVDGFGDGDMKSNGHCSGEGKARMSMQEFDDIPAPRVLKTHAPRELFLAEGPKGEGLAPGVKVIYVTRNPFDACVSCYYHPKPGMSPATTGWPFDAFARLYLSDRIEFGGWVNHVTSWYEEYQRSPNQILWMSYEDLVKEPYDSINRVVQFLGLKLDEGCIQRVVEGSRFSNVKAKAQETLASTGKGDVSHLRKGAIGDWRNHFSTSLWAEFVAQLHAQCSVQSLDLAFDIGENDVWFPSPPSPDTSRRYLTTTENIRGSPHYDVIIVGLGPVGGVLACLLARTSHRVLVLERTDLDPSKTNPRAVNLDSHSMAILVQEVGLGKAWVDTTRPFPGGHFVSSYPEPQWLGIGKTSSDEFNPIFGPLNVDRGPTGYPASVFYQPELERQLRAKLEEAENVTVKTLQKVIAYDSIDDGRAVLVKTERMKGSWQQSGNNEWVCSSGLAESFEEFTCSFLVGCDGAHSRVRALLCNNSSEEELAKGCEDGKFCVQRAASKIHENAVPSRSPSKESNAVPSRSPSKESHLDFDHIFERSTTLAFDNYDELWLVIDVVLHNESLIGTKIPHLAQQICDPKRAATIVPGSWVWDGQHIKAGCSPGRHYRWEFLLDTEVDDLNKMVQNSTIFELLAPWVSQDDVSIVRATTYRARGSDAHVWNQGQVFLMGDAAHTMPPFLGQGLNQGIQDAMNLAWKLNFVLSGGCDRILKTYEIERRPIATHMTVGAVKIGVQINMLLKAVRAGPEEFHATLEELTNADIEDPGSLTGRKGSYGPYGGNWGEPMTPAIKGPLKWMPWGDRESRTQYVGRILPQPVVHTKEGSHMLYEHMGAGFCLLYNDVFPNICSEEAAQAFESIGAKLLPLDVCSNGGASFFLGGVFATFVAVLVRPDRQVFGVAISEEEVNAMIDSLVNFLCSDDLGIDIHKFLRQES